MVTSSTKKFCELIRNRSEENRQAIQSLKPLWRVLSPAVSILRQELDSMVRVIYLLSIKDLSERHRLIESTLKGEKWKLLTPKGKWRLITDKEMVELSQSLQGWTKSVYKFGCAFIHLSNLHNYFAENPFDNLEESEKQDILSHKRNYHGGLSHDNPDMEELSSYGAKIGDRRNFFQEMKLIERRRKGETLWSHTQWILVAMTALIPAVYDYIYAQIVGITPRRNVILGIEQRHRLWL